MSLTTSYSVEIAGNLSSNSSDCPHECVDIPSFDSLSAVKLGVCLSMVVLSTVGNALVLVALYRKGKRISSVNRLIIHLAISDLLVTFSLIFTTAIWNVTVEWLAGDFMCKLVKFLGMFGQYLSTYITVAIGVDRFIVISYPLRNISRRKKTRLVLLMCWIGSAVLSLPQAFIFGVVEVQGFYQCVTVVYTEDWQEQLYATFVIAAMYAVPLTLMIILYFSIFHTLGKKVTENHHLGEICKMREARSIFFRKAKIRTLWMTLTIVLSFIITWTPFYVLAIWYLFGDWNSIPHAVFEICLLFGMFNSCVNPFVYGIYNYRLCCGGAFSKENESYRSKNIPGVKYSIPGLPSNRMKSSIILSYNSVRESSSSCL